MHSPRWGILPRALSLLLLRTLEGTQDALEAGESLYLRVKNSGACLTVEEYNGEARSKSVHAQYWHHGLWQELTVFKDGGREGDAVESGDSIRLRGHNGNWIEVAGKEVSALSRKRPSQGLVIEKEDGSSGPIHMGDTVFLRGPSGQYIGVRGSDVTAESSSKGSKQAFVAESHARGPFDGRWTEEDAPGEEVYVIQGSALHFVDTIEFGMFPQGGNRFTTGLQGWSAHDGGELKDGKLMWSNGDVWIPVKGPFDGRWTDLRRPGETIFHISGDTLRVVGGHESKIQKLSGSKFTTGEPRAPDVVAELVGTRLYWGNGDTWVMLAAGRFDGRWTVKVNPGGDFFDIQGDMLFFDPGLESRIMLDGQSFTTELRGSRSHAQATLSDDGNELHWNNGDVWARFHVGHGDFWVHPSVVAATGAPTTIAPTTTTATTTSTLVATTATTTSTLVATTAEATTTSTLVATTATTTSTLVATTATTTSTLVATTVATTTPAAPTAPKLAATTVATTTPAATTPTLVATTVVTTHPASPVGPEGGCFEDSVVYEPLDMDHQRLSLEENITACQHRCFRTRGCTHFTYWHLATPGHCHLQDVYALKSVFRLGFTAGPPHCYETVNSSKHGLVRLEQGDVGPKTYVPYAYRCLKMSRMYAPIAHSEFLTKKKGYATARKAVKGCRDLCVKTESCEYYSIGFPGRLCSLSPKGAKEVKYIIKHIAGPKNCSVEDNGGGSDGEESAPLQDSSPLNGTVDLFLEDQDGEARPGQAALAFGSAPALGLAAAGLVLAGGLALLGMSAARMAAPRSGRRRAPRPGSLEEGAVGEQEHLRVLAGEEENDNPAE